MKKGHFSNLSNAKIKFLFFLQNSYVSRIYEEEFRLKANVFLERNNILYMYTSAHFTQYIVNNSNYMFSYVCLIFFVIYYFSFYPAH